MNNRTSLICKQCDKVFYPKSGHLKQKTCSTECGHLYRIKNGGTRKGKTYPHLQRSETRACLVCDKEFRATKDFKQRKQKYCSTACYSVHWVKEIRPTLDTSTSGVKGESNHMWKGDSVGYHGLHRWVARELGKPMKCDNCSDTSLRKYEWANLSHQYKRDVSDWARFCTPCHRAYDMGKLDVIRKRYHKFVTGSEEGWQDGTPRIGVQ